MQPLNPGLIGRCVKKPAINAEDQRVEEDVGLKPHNQEKDLAVLLQIKEKHAHLKLIFGRNTRRRSYVIYQNAHVCTHYCNFLRANILYLQAKSLQNTCHYVHEKEVLLSEVALKFQMGKLFKGGQYSRGDTIELKKVLTGDTTYSWNSLF